MDRLRSTSVQRNESSGNTAELRQSEIFKLLPGFVIDAFSFQVSLWPRLDGNQKIRNLVSRVFNDDRIHIVERSSNGKIR